jgi:transcriptional regulator with XRE-family HTH domain
MSDAYGRGETSPEELALEAELHRTYISGVERGVRHPTVTVVAKIAKALGVTPDQLLRTRR